MKFLKYHIDWILCLVVSTMLVFILMMLAKAPLEHALWGSDNNDSISILSTKDTKKVTTQRELLKQNTDFTISIAAKDFYRSPSVKASNNSYRFLTLEDGVQIAILIDEDSLDHNVDTSSSNKMRLPIGSLVKKPLDKSLIIMARKAGCVNLATEYYVDMSTAPKSEQSLFHSYYTLFLIVILILVLTYFVHHLVYRYYLRH
ncbi:hypothetical protein lbkm_1619 [Lachnospiraceae bacterium KM106-2]|nr:hypothetical protein lbkm_1619 [Lachnospiraceae bacterium KM106-2]